MADATIKNIPRNPALGVIADWLMSAKKTGGTIGDFFLGKSPEVLDSLSYGFKPTTGQGMTFGVKPEAVDLMNLTPIGSLAGMAGKPVAKMAGREIARQVETGTGILGRNVIDPRMNIVKDEGLQNQAIDYFKLTQRPSETGYILDNGKRLDFSGRYQAPSDYDVIGGQYFPKQGKTDYFRNERGVDHRTVSEIMPNTQYGWDSLSNFIDKTGAIRYMQDVGASMVDTNKPSDTQIKALVDDFRKSGEMLTIDIDRMKDGQNLYSKDFEKPTFESVKKWIDETYKGFKK